MKPARTLGHLPFILIAAAVILLTAGGWEYYHHSRKSIRSAALDDLNMTAELKADSIESWCRERLGDALVISKSSINRLRVIPFLESSNPPPDLEADIRGWMEARLEAFGYIDAVLVDADKNPRLTLGSSRTGIGEHAREAIERILQTGKPELSDFHEAELFPEPHLDLYAPIPRRDAAGDVLGCAGVLVLRIDPRRSLRSLINAIPIPGATAETILARRDEGGFLVLNDLRLGKESALRLRDPISGLDGIPVQPIVGDYRGMSVMAAVRKLSDSPWYLIVKKDVSEIDAPLRTRMFIWTLSALGIVAGIALLLLFWVKRREARFYRRELEDERRHLALVRHFEYLQKYANDIILLADNEQNLIEANDRACEAYGYSRDELLAKRIPELSATGMKIGFQEAVDEAAARGGLIFEALHRRRDGTTFPVEISLRTIELEGARFHQAIIRDISERRAMLEARRSSEMKYKTLFEMANDAIFLLDGETFIDCNVKTLEIFGCDRDGILGKKPPDFSPPNQPDGSKSEDMARDRIEKALAGIPQRFEWKHRKPEGTEIETDVSLSRIDLGGRPLIQAIVRDISGTKKAEAELREAVREKDVLLREIHHRVKNNMQVVSSLLNLQAQRFRDGEVLEAFRESQSRIRSMALVHEKLYRAKTLSQVDFADYIMSLTASLLRAYPVNPERIGIRMDLDRVNLDINASIPCGLILNEVILNSLKHAFPEGRKGEIHIELREKDAGTVRLTVRDNGIGFPEGIDIRNTDTLGLQIVTLLADQLDGTFDIRKDGGTVFALTFRAPLYKDRI